MANITPPYANNGPYTSHMMNTEFISGGADLSALEKVAAWPLAAINAGAAALWNSAIKIGHIGLSEAEEVAFDAKYEVSGRQLTQQLYGRAWASFYDRNQESIELGGELASLVVPGTVALKGMRLARSGNFGKYYNLLDASRMRDKYTKQMLEAERNFGEYSQMFSAGRKVQALNVATSLQEAAAISLTSAVMLNDSRLYQDYGTRAFMTETAFGGVLGAAFRALGTRTALKKEITEYERMWRTENDFSSPLKMFSPNENIVNMTVDRAGKQSTDSAQATAWELGVRAELGKLATDASAAEDIGKILMPAVRQYTRLDAPEAAQRMSEVFSGLKSIERFDPKAGAIAEPQVLGNGKKLYPAYLDRFTGDVAAEVELGAAEAGFTIAQKGARIIGPDKKVRNTLDLATKFKESKGLEVTPQEADALHQLYTRAGKSTALQNTLLPRVNGQLVIDEENLLHLELARESGKRWQTLQGREIGETEMRTLMREQKEQILLEWNQSPNLLRTEEQQRMILNSQLDPQKLGDEINPFSGALPAQEEFAPRLLKLNYEIAPDSKELAQATLLENVFAEKHRANFAGVLETYGISPRNLRAGELTSTDLQSGAINFGARGVYASAQNAVEFIGTQTRNAIGALTSKWRNKLEVTAAPFLRDATDLGEFNIFAVQIQRRPAELSIVDLPNGNLALYERVKTDSGKVILQRAKALDEKGLPTANELPEIKGRTAKAMMRELRDGVGKEFRDRHNQRVAARGRGTKLDDTVAYIPPTMGRYFAIVRFPDGRAQSMVRGASPEDLQDRIRVMREQYPEAQILEKREAQLAIEKDGLYGDDFSFFENLEANFEVARKGLGAEQMIGNDTRIVDSILDFYARGASALVRNAVKDYYEPEIALLQQTQNRFSQVIGSRFGRQLSREEEFLDRNTPFEDRIRTMLDISQQRRLPILNSLNEAVEALGAKAYEVVRNLRPLPPEDKIIETGKKLNEIARAAGMGQDFTNVQQQLDLTRKYNPKFASSLVARTNMVFATAQLGVDAANTMVNLLSYAIGAVPEILHLQKQIVTGAIDGGIAGVKVPGTSQSIFTPYRALAQVAKELSPWGDRSNLNRMVKNGIIPPRTQEYFDALDEYAKGLKEGAQTGSWNTAMRVGKEIVPTIREWLLEKPNSYLRYASVRSVELLLKDSGLPQDMVEHIASQFVKRVQHNFPFGQRPLIFQGPVGQAVTLYQTYMFNTIQNLARYIGEGDTRALTAFMGIQSATFGMQSNPLFKAVNDAIAFRDGNPDRRDLYSAFQDADWLLYGAPSAALNVNIYVRGDLSPRSNILLPTTPADIPAVSQTARLVGSLFDGAKRIASAAGEEGGIDFGRVGQIMNQTVQESGFSRPLAGAAALLSGQVVDTRGNLVSDSIGFADAMRLTGARPFEEGKLLDLQRRFIDKKLEDRELIMKFGKKIREKIRTGEEFSAADLAEAVKGYTKAGGNEDNFLNWLKLETEKATVPLAKRLADRYKNDPDMAPWLNYLNDRAMGLD